LYRISATFAHAGLRPLSANSIPSFERAPPPPVASSSPFKKFHSCARGPATAPDAATLKPLPLIHSAPRYRVRTREPGGDKARYLPDLRPLRESQANTFPCAATRRSCMCAGRVTSQPHSRTYARRHPNCWTALGRVGRRGALDVRTLSGESLDIMIE
jgi:hypothetical protein